MLLKLLLLGYILKSNAQKLDDFMMRSNLKYIEPTQTTIEKPVQNNNVNPEGEQNVPV
jgi:hypothetical protein